MARVAQGLGLVFAIAAVVVASILVPSAGASGYPGTTVKTTTVTTKVAVSPSGGATGSSGGSHDPGSAGVIPKGAPGTGGSPLGGSGGALFAGAGLAILAGVAALGLALGRRRPHVVGPRRGGGSDRDE